MARRKQQGEFPSQRDYRRFLKATDQHGRRWQGTVETDTLGVVGEWQYVPAVDRQTGEKIVPPLLPPSWTMRVLENEVGRITIDYDRWIAREQARIRDWDLQVRGYARSMYGQKAGEVLREVPLPPELSELAGPRPEPWERIEACKRGNKWALGIPEADGTAPKRPAWADKYFHEPEPEADLAFPDFDEDALADADPGADDDPGGDEFPKRSGPWFILSNGTRCPQGTTREVAEDMELELMETADT